MQEKQLLKLRRVKRIRKGKTQGQHEESLLEKQLLLRWMKMIGKEKRQGQQE